MKKILSILITIVILITVINCRPKTFGNEILCDTRLCELENLYYDVVIESDWHETTEPIISSMLSDIGIEEYSDKWLEMIVQSYYNFTLRYDEVSESWIINEELVGD